MTNTTKLIAHLMDYLDSREHPGQQVIVYLDSLHPDADGCEDERTLEDLIRDAHRESTDIDYVFPLLNR